MEPNDLLCAICAQPGPDALALHLGLSRAANAWLCVSCTVAVERALDLDTLVSCAICHWRAEPRQYALRVAGAWHRQRPV
jgi:hypothetical protein